MVNTPTTSTTSSEDLLKDCLTTYRICRETANHGRQMGGEWTETGLVGLLNDCADINLVVVELLSRGSRFSRDLCVVGARISEACAEALEPFEHDDAQLRVAYATCRRSHLVCSFLSGALPQEHFDPRDVALDGTFPASDPLPPPTEI